MIDAVLTRMEEYEKAKRVLSLLQGEKRVYPLSDVDILLSGHSAGRIPGL